MPAQNLSLASASCLHDANTDGALSAMQAPVPYHSSLAIKPAGPLNSMLICTPAQLIKTSKERNNGLEKDGRTAEDVIIRHEDVVEEQDVGQEQGGELVPPSFEILQANKCYSSDFKILLFRHKTALDESGLPVISPPADPPQLLVLPQLSPKQLPKKRGRPPKKLVPTTTKYDWQAAADIIQSGEPAAGIIQSGDPAAGGILQSGEPAAGILQSGEPAAGIIQSGEPAAGIIQSGEPAAGVIQSGEPAAGIIQSGEPAAGVIQSGEPAAGIIQSGEPAAGVIQSGEPAADNITEQPESPASEGLCPHCSLGKTAVIGDRRHYFCLKARKEQTVIRRCEKVHLVFFTVKVFKPIDKDRI